MIDYTNIDKIIEQMKEMDKRIIQLEREVAQAEGFCAAVVKNVKCEIKMSFNELYESDYAKVRVFPEDDDHTIITVKYIEE